MLRMSGKYFAWVFYLILIIVLIIGCSNTKDNIATPPIEPPDAPSGLDVDDSEPADVEDEPYLGGDEGDIEIPPPEMGEDGNYWVQVILPEVRTDGVYIGVYEEPDGEGEEGGGEEADLPYGGKNPAQTAECLPGEENTVACPLPAGPEEAAWFFHVEFLEATAPIFPGGYQFLHKAVRRASEYGLPPGFEGDSPFSQMDQNMLLWRLCKDWAANEEPPDYLDSFCAVLLENLESGNVAGMPMSDFNCMEGVEFEWCSNVWAIDPDPDCDGEDAGTFWCQETKSQPYLAGRLATACRDELGLSFEDPLTAFEDPLTAFEDPLTAMNSFEAALNTAIAGFEDPLTAFEDPLTAFEDPLTSFEDPLTAFEDPLTAVEVGQLTVWYAGMRPFIGKIKPFPSCNALAQLGDVSNYRLTGENLFATLYKYFKTPVEVSKPQTVYAPAVMDNPSHCSIYNNLTIYDPYFFVNQQNNNVYLHFPFPDLVPGHSLDVPGDVLPHLYTATLGGVDSEPCLPGHPDQVDCDVTMLGRNNQILYDVPVELYVSGCTQPIYTGAITLPGIDYNRCDFFLSVNMGLNIANPSTDLQLYVTMDTGVPGVEVPNLSGWDQMPVSYMSTLEGMNASTYTVPSYPGRLYSDFAISMGDFNHPLLYQLWVNQCDRPIFSQAITVVPNTGSEDGSGGGIVPACTGTLSESQCTASGGTYHPVTVSKAAWCECP